MDASFVTDAIDKVVLESGALCLGNCLFFLLSMAGKEVSLSMS